MATRTLRRTATAWFGPKRMIGWGWTPRSWQGWLVTAVFVAVVVIAGATIQDQVLRWSSFVIAIVLYILVIVFTGDPPGGRAH